jgi:hypothetical protein
MDSKWIPVRLDFNATGEEITWLDCAGLSFDAPFFDQTVRQIEPSRPRMITPLAHDPDVDSLAPLALIFHVSRCGSTLLANSMRALDDAIVISEAQPVNAALAISDPALLSRMMKHLGVRLKGAERRLFFKLTSWNLTRLAVMRAAFPETPAIFLCRDPVEVMASNLTNRDGWMTLHDRPDEAKSLFGWRDADVRAMSAEEYCARVLGQFFWSIASLKKTRDIVLDYRDLNAATILRVLEKLNIAPIPAESSRIAAEFAVYSKDRTRSFENDSEQKRSTATPHAIEMANTYAYPMWRRLMP